MDELEVVVLCRTEAIEIFKRAYAAAGETASAYPRDFAGISTPRLCPPWLRPKTWKSIAIVSAVCLTGSMLFPIFTGSGDLLQGFLIPLFQWSSLCLFVLAFALCVVSFRHVSLGEPAVVHRIAEQVWLEQGPCDIAFSGLGPKRKWVRYHENNPPIKAGEVR